MPEPITYFIDQTNGTVDLALTDERLIAKTQGKGLIDKPRIVDISFADLKNFCLAPTIAPQNLVSYTSPGDLLLRFRIYLCISRAGKVEAEKNVR